MEEIAKEYTDKELLDKCLDRMSYYQKAYMDLRVETAKVLSAVVLDTGVGFLKEDTQSQVSKLYRKHQPALL